MILGFMYGNSFPFYDKITLEVANFYFLHVFHCLIFIEMPEPDIYSITAFHL